MMNKSFFELVLFEFFSINMSQTLNKNVYQLNKNIFRKLEKFYFVYSKSREGNVSHFWLIFFLGQIRPWTVCKG